MAFNIECQQLLEYREREREMVPPSDLSHAEHVISLPFVSVFKSHLLQLHGINVTVGEIPSGAKFGPTPIHRNILILRSMILIKWPH